jgi:DNA-binding transcriptional ArsR family regulator
MNTRNTSQVSKRRQSRKPADLPDVAGWMFFTNHTHVLLWLSEQSDARVKDIAAVVGVTERAVQRILSELEEAGFVTRQRVGRRNTYVVHANRPLRHPLEAHCTVEAVLDVIMSTRPERRTFARSGR